MSLISHKTSIFHYRNRLVRTYLVCIFPKKGLSTWCKTNHFFKFKKDIPYERNALNRTDNTPCQNWPQRSKRFNQLLKSEI